MLKQKHAVKSLVMMIAALSTGAAQAHEEDRVSDWTTVDTFSLDENTGKAVAEVCNHNYSRALQCEIEIEAEYAQIRTIDTKTQWYSTGTIRPNQCMRFEMSGADDGVEATADDQFNPEKPVRGRSICRPTEQEERRMEREERAEERREAQEISRARRKCRYPRLRSNSGFHASARVSIDTGYIVPVVPLVLVAPVAVVRPPMTGCAYQWIQVGLMYQYQWVCSTF